MKIAARLLSLTVFAGALTLGLSGVAQASSWQIDPAHSTAGFTVKHMMFTKVPGEFGKVEGTVHLDDKDVTRSTVEATIDARTITTHNASRDADLKSPKFFDVAKYPTITFKSTKVERAGKDKLKVEGNLTMHGVTRPVTLTVEGPSPALKDPWGNVRRSASATTEIDRKDFGLTWNKKLDGGGVLVGDRIPISIDLEMVEGQKK